MNAVQPSRGNGQPPPKNRTNSRKQRQRRQHSYQAMTGEIAAKLLVNVVLSAAAIAGLSQLLPYHLSQQGKLREVQAEVKRTQSRVNNLRNDFGNVFDPAQAKKVMQEQSYR
ncbi:MAG TPA: hypothetical protein DEG17_20315, partial [Cyanobacteria bacterium UBA11149]|nr:hypothetical protein [Cyanobacteria bacterium UBA11149]